MKLCISLSMFNSKCLVYYFIFAIFQIYKYLVFYYDESNENNGNDEKNGDILDNNKLFHSFCFFLGYLLNIFPSLINQRNSKTHEDFIINESKGERSQSIKYIYSKTFVKNLSTKDIIIFFFKMFYLINNRFY